MKLFLGKACKSLKTSEKNFSGQLGSRLLSNAYY